MHSQTVYSEVEPLVSVVICNFNSEEYLERCLLSLQNGSYKRIEVVLVNDCSEGDDSIIVEKYRKKLNIVYVKNSVNIGLLQSRLEGVRNSSGEYITFLDADDELSVDFVRNNVKEVLLNKADLLRCHLSIKTQGTSAQKVGDVI